jgi:hypothetical protein
MQDVKLFPLGLLSADILFAVVFVFCYVMVLIFLKGILFAR